MVMAGVVGHYRAEQLFPALDVRYETEAQIRDHARVTLQRLGLELINLRFVDFVGEDYEELRRQRKQMQVDPGQGDLHEQRLALVQRLRELDAQERMHDIKTEKDLENFIRQTEHELGIKNVIRDDEMKRLKERFAFEHERESVLRVLEIAAIRREDVREQAWKDLLAEERARDERHKRQLERELLTARTDEEKAEIQMRIRRLDHEQDVREARDGLDLLERRKDIDQDELDRESQRSMREADSATERRVKEVEAFSKADAQALIAIVDGPAGEQLLQLEQFRLQKGMSPEQLLAVAPQRRQTRPERSLRSTSPMVRCQKICWRS